MKKLLIATAVLATFASAAQAQSNVTIYGAYGNGLTSTETAGAKAVNTMDGSRLGTPVLGFRGTEDLGGGNQAFFNLESTLGANGNLGFTSTTGATNIFDRLAFAGLSSKTLGTLTLGRQNDAMKEIEGLAALNNMIDAHNITTVGDRTANLTKYTSPSIEGLTVTYAYSDSAVTGSVADHATGVSNTSAALDGVKHRSFNAQYTIQGVKLAVAQADAATTTGGETSSTRYTAQGIVMGATVGVAYTKNDTSATDTRDQLLVSTRVPFSNGFALFASYADNDSTVSTTNGKAYSLMLTKDLSKRTTVYAGYSDADYDGSSADVKVTAFGLLHKF
jgi:predicted porin